MRLSQSLTKTVVLKLICLMALLIALSGCTSRTITNTEYLYPPAAYLVPCERTEFSGKTYGDTVEYLVRVMGERDLCASQIDRIREWQASHKFKN
ncbi:Rz1-like lysis system protein LysC [Actinobacillus pleuropneumoniae]|uniref:Rz1-like lysis system protein LysC n=2 Tax=Actinobacillus pleuropneumoniae TaxID=715 RepID=UPI003D3331BB